MSETAQNLVETTSEAWKWYHALTQVKFWTAKRNKIAKSLRPHLTSGAIQCAEDREVYLGGGYEKQTTEIKVPAVALIAAMLADGADPDEIQDLVSLDVVVTSTTRNLRTGKVDTYQAPNPIRAYAKHLATFTAVVDSSRSDGLKDRALSE